MGLVDYWYSFSQSLEGCSFDTIVASAFAVVPVIRVRQHSEQDLAKKDLKNADRVPNTIAQRKRDRTSYSRHRHSVHESVRTHLRC